MSKQKFVTDFMWKPNWPLHKFVLFLFFKSPPPPPSHLFYKDDTEVVTFLVLGGKRHNKILLPFWGTVRHEEFRSWIIANLIGSAVRQRRLKRKLKLFLYILNLSGVVFLKPLTLFLSLCLPFVFRVIVVFLLLRSLCCFFFSTLPRMIQRSPHVDDFWLVVQHTF